MQRRPITFLRLHYVVEILIIVALAWVATDGYHNFDPNWRLAGIETEYLTSSAEWVSDVFQTSHYIPQWQPYLDTGQPVVDEAYAFTTNPFTIVPILLFGGPNGIKISIILHFMIVGIGGWFLGWTLGWRWLARLLVGCLLILKGNMQGTLGLGFFQLGVAQAYFPWVFAGAFAIINHPTRRWPIILLALSLALLYLVGNLYYVLPAMLIVVLVVIFFCFSPRLSPPFVTVETERLKKFLVAGGLTLALCAVTALTIGLNYGLMGGHPDVTIVARSDVDVSMAVMQFVEPERYVLGLFAENYYTYSTPLWFLGLLLILLPPIPVLNRPAKRWQGLRLWVACLVGLALFTTWGLATNPVINWMYAHLPFIGQWRYPERMLTMAAFLFIFLLGLRLDGLYRAVVLAIDYGKRRTGAITRVLVGASLAAACAFAVVEVLKSRYVFDYLWQIPLQDTACLSWLNATYPDRFLSVKRVDYGYVIPYMRAHIRLQTVGAAYDLFGLPSTIYPNNLTDTLPEFYMTKWDDDPVYLRSLGYLPEEDSPPIAPDLLRPCVWRKRDATPYAFSVRLDELQSAETPLPRQITTPVAYLGRTPEHIWLDAQPDPTGDTVVVAQDLAYPGWTVTVDGKSARLESVGGIIGVVLPPGTTPALVEFVYSAPTLKIGALITVIAGLASIFYLLEVDKLRGRKFALPRIRRRQAAQVAPPPPVTMPTPAVPVVPVPPPVAAPVPAVPVASGGRVRQKPEPLADEPLDVTDEPVGVSRESEAFPRSSRVVPIDVSEVPTGVRATLEGEVITPAVQVAADYTRIRIVVPPSRMPTHIEVVVPASPKESGGKNSRGLMALVGMAMAMLFWLANARKPKQ